MSWQPIDFQGIVSLDAPIVELLTKYLDRKEEVLAQEILHAIPPTITESQAPRIPFATAPTLIKLSDAIEAFIKKEYRSEFGKPAVLLDDWKLSVKKINNALWAYVETIEDCVNELFLQLDQIGLEQWHTHLAEVISSIKETVIHRTEELIWGIRRLEKQLWRCRLACETPGSWKNMWIKASHLWKKALDPELITHLTKSQESLQTQYDKFMKRYQGFLQLQEQVQKSLDKLNGYQEFAVMDREFQRQFLKFYQLLKLWDLNQKEKVLPNREFVLALRNTLSADRAQGLLKEYHSALKWSLFDKSLTLKERTEEFYDESGTKTRMQEGLTSCIAESNLLGSTITHYREFILKADPNPYARTRLGFSDWVAGPEPAQTKPLLDLGYETETLAKGFEKLSHTVQEGPSVRKNNLDDLDQKMHHVLHEISQPLATQRKTRHWAEKAVDILEEVNELGSYDMATIDYVGDAFAKLMRADWKYHVLWGFPLFHELYTIHQGLVPPIEDRQHKVRLEKFQRLLFQIQDWVVNKKTQAHFYDIELDINDIKGYLQDFLGYVQRTLNNPELPPEEKASQLSQLKQQLLEYRYLFGNFFYQLHQNESEGYLIRRQFLFVDQYFESVYSLLAKS